MTDLPDVPPEHPSTEPSWPPMWVRALLPTAILASLDGTPLHGYAIAQALGARGFGVPRGGSLYPALAKLEEAGAIEAAWTPGASGPARRQYTLTGAGRDRLARERTQLTDLAEALRPDDTVATSAPATASHIEPARSDPAPAAASTGGTDDHRR
ncbi:PadR family transcriptional regulator [Brachybacterium kimchii]|uniref:PadR family transcriptional regulator n=1 Tax=Brachybacterium kimchii TaxID=2942909 RepID=A0ABY4N282_9MICO|nr:PadR family transcriptional regulator [Brachybacterium kimchii]UQN28201.1 PadR family transcriptional regulator [Brachybacterium kimchii]